MNMCYPITIKRVTITCAGDMSVGIQPEHYEAECYFTAYEECDINQFRKTFKDCYASFTDGTPRVSFDFEIFYWQEQETSMLNTLEDNKPTEI